MEVLIVCKDPFDMPDEVLEAEGAGAEGEVVYVLNNGTAEPLKVPDDSGEEDHDNVDYD